MSNDKLAPCPFCGSGNIQIVRPFKPAGVYWALCQDCWATGPKLGNGSNAEKAWNLRRQDSETAMDVQPPFVASA